MTNVSQAIETINGESVFTVTYDIAEGVPGDETDSTDIQIVDPTGPAVIPDTDGDGVLDNVDVCPGGDDNADADGDSVPDFCDLDDDNDGITDVDEQLVCGTFVLDLSDVDAATPNVSGGSISGSTVTFEGFINQGNNTSQSPSGNAQGSISLAVAGDPSLNEVNLYAIQFAQPVILDIQQSLSLIHI